MPSAELLTRNVFVDTEAIKRADCKFTTGILNNLVELSIKSKIFVYLTDITAQEVMGQLRDKAKEVKDSHEAFRKKARLLMDFDAERYGPLFAELELTQIEKGLTGHFEAFLDRAKVRIISTERASLADICEKYFKREAPFGEGKKRCEFPDAIALSSLANWAEAEDQCIYVVSGDGDMEAACAHEERLIHLGTLREFLDNVFKAEEDFPRSLSESISENLEVFKRAIEDYFPKLGFWLEDEDGDVNEVSVQSVDIIEHSIINLEDERAVLEMPAKIVFQAEVSYDNMETASYDSEDKVLIPWETIETTLERTDIYEVEFTISFDRNDPARFTIDDLELGHPEGLGIAVNEGTYPYK